MIFCFEHLKMCTILGKGLLQSWQIGAMLPIDKEALENRIDFASTMTHMWLVNMDIKETDDI